MDSLQGHLLIAAPQLLDPNFHRSVVLLVEHNTHGALGLILNRPTNTTIASVWSQASETPCRHDLPIHQGGPCEGPLMVLHGHRDLAQVAVCPGVGFTTDRDQVESLVAETYEPIKFFYGHSGWAAGQLESELEGGSWLTAPAIAEHVFGTTSDLWQQLMRRLTPRVQTIDPAIMPEDPRLN